MHVASYATCRNYASMVALWGIGRFTEEAILSIYWFICCYHGSMRGDSGTGPECRREISVQQNRP